jgi:hypothetical protein
LRAIIVGLLSGDIALGYFPTMQVYPVVGRPLNAIQSATPDDRESRECKRKTTREYLVARFTEPLLEVILLPSLFAIILDNVEIVKRYFYLNLFSPF